MSDVERILKSAHLPTLPSVAIRLLDFSKSGVGEPEELVEIIRVDPAMSARVLKSTNSAFSGLRKQVGSVERAVGLLGVKTITSLALGFYLNDASAPGCPLAGHFHEYWLQSITQAAAARCFGEIIAPGRDGEWFLIGLMLDIGQLAMLNVIPQEYTAVLAKSAEKERDLREVENEVLGFSHCELGARMVERWGLPASMQEAIRFHDSPFEQIIAAAATSQHDALKVAALAAGVGRYLCRLKNGSSLERLQVLAAHFCGCDAEGLGALLQKTRQQIAEVGDMFSVCTDGIPDPIELMAEANDQLTELTLRAQFERANALEVQGKAEQAMSELHQQNQQLQQLALIDPLTKVYNREYFDESITKQLNRCVRERSSIGVIFIDIDHFKSFNDSHGHLCGDHVLKEVAQRIAESIRTCDTLARYGGEEFVIWVHEPQEAHLSLIAERIRARVESSKIEFGAHVCRVTISVGGIVAHPSQTEPFDADGLVALADEAMYRSKANGRNQATIRSLQPDEVLQNLIAGLQ